MGALTLWMRASAFGLLTVLLTGCPRMTPPPAAMAPIPARAFLVSGEVPLGDFGAFGYVVFTVRPSPTDSSRHLRLCDSFLRHLEPASEYADDVNPRSVMMTYWLLRSRAAESECSTLVAEYDYSRGTTVAATVNKLAAVGPILVAWPVPYSDTTSAEGALVLDLSSFRPEDFDRALLIWRNRIVRDPLSWNRGFALENVREVFRSLIQQYGQVIVDVFRGTQ